MDNKSRILHAAAQLFSKHGFRGATTRRIAQRAGVNEVTIFRAFGSKDRLIAQAINFHAARTEQTPLPETPVNPERELTEWCAAHLARLRRARAFIRTCMGEHEERPHLAPSAAHGPGAAREQLSGYLLKLRAAGMIEQDANRNGAIAMLLGACFADAMGRDIMPAIFPQPASKAAPEYTRLFLKSLGFDGAGKAGRRTKEVRRKQPIPRS